MSLSWSCLLYGQEWENETGEIEDAEVVIEKDKKIELPKANRLYEKIAPLPLQHQSGVQEFDIKDFNYQLKDIDPRLRILTIKDPLLKKLYANYIKAGGGNYGSALLEAYINNKRSEQYAYGLHAKHNSSARGPVDKKNSASSDDYIGIHGKTFFDQFILGGSMNYQGKQQYFYGYNQNLDVIRDTIEQKFTNVYMDVTFESRDTDSDFYFKLNPSFSFLKDNFEAKENRFGIDFLSRFSIDENIGFNISSNVSLANRKDHGELSRNLVKIKPSIDFKAGELKVNAGVNIVFEGDSIMDNKSTRLYLTGKVMYNVTGQVDLYAGLDGDLEEVSLHSIVNENPFINQAIPLLHQNKELDFYGGIKGSLFNSFSFNGGFSIADYKNFHFYINDPLDSAKFNLVYERNNTTRFNFFTEVGVDKTNLFRGRVRFDFYAYDLSIIDRPWHLPSYKFSFLGSFNLFDKILFNSDIYTMGGIRAKAINTSDVINLDPIVDVNFKLDYRYSEQVSMFMSFNNILSKNYERYYNYPSRGFMFMLGLTYAFDRL